jgi:hypothetical protein
MKPTLHAVKRPTPRFDAVRTRSLVEQADRAWASIATKIRVKCDIAIKAAASQGSTQVSYLVPLQLPSLPIYINNMTRVIELLAEGLRNDRYRVDASKNPIVITIAGSRGGGGSSSSSSKENKKKVIGTDTNRSSSDLFSKLVQEAREKERRKKKKKHQQH